LFQAEEFGFEKIGKAYPSSLPIWSLRAVPALAGAGLIPTVYSLAAELGLGSWTGALAGVLVLLGKKIVSVNFSAISYSKVFH